MSGEDDLRPKPAYCKCAPTPAEPARESDGMGLRDLEITIGLLPDCDHSTSRGVCPNCTAEAVLASDWLAARVAEAGARAWDEGWRTGRGRGPGHTADCPIGGGRSDNPYEAREPRGQR